MTPDLTYLSLGAGVQSTALYLLADQGELPTRPDVAIFADTQQEPPWVYQNLERLKGQGSIPIYVVSRGDLGEAVRQEALGLGPYNASVPFWIKTPTGERAAGRRTCTRYYKIEAIHHQVRTLLGLSKGERAAGRFHVEEWVGISFDEFSRAKHSPHSWIHTRWPLLESKWHRWHCVQYLESIAYPVPGRSACVFCPYHPIKHFARLAQEAPEVFEQACEWDELLRAEPVGPRSLLRGSYVSSTLTPLREAVALYQLEQEEQVELPFDECEGLCGV